MLQGTGSIPVNSHIIIKGGLCIMEILINGLLGATIANFMKNVKNTKNIIVFSISLILASIVAEL